MNQIKIKQLNWIDRDLISIAYSPFGTFEITRKNAKGEMYPLNKESSSLFSVYISRPTTDECIQCQSDFDSLEKAKEWAQNDHNIHCLDLFEGKLTF
jgi:hypothetical protein